MAHDDQKPLGSGFGPRTTALEAVAGVDLKGANAIVTGASSGLGPQIVRALAAAGARVTAPVREPAKGRLALHGVPNVTVAQMDLSDLASVRAFAEQWRAENGPLHILINNAGVMACPEERIGQGWERQLATNHFGHYALVSHLAPALQGAGGARVVSVSSLGHRLSPMRWDDPHFRTGGYDKWVAYGQSKTANSLFALGLDEVGARHGVRAFAVHPGGIMTELQRHLPREEMVAFGWMDEAGNVNPNFKNEEQGAATAVWAATSPMLSGRGGVYCEDCDIAQLAGPDSPPYAHVRPHAVYPGEARRLMSWTAEQTGLTIFS